MARLGYQRGVGHPGAHGQHQDGGAVVVEGRAEGAAEADHEVLGADVDRAAGEQLEAEDRGDVDDDAAAAPLVLAHVLEAEEGAAGHRRLVGIGGLLLGGCLERWEDVGSGFGAGNTHLTQSVVEDASSWFALMNEERYIQSVH